MMGLSYKKKAEPWKPNIALKTSCQRCFCMRCRDFLNAEATPQGVDFHWISNGSLAPALSIQKVRGISLIEASKYPPPTMGLKSLQNQSF